MPGRARPLAGEHLRRRLTSCCDRLMQVLRRPVEPKLRTPLNAVIGFSDLMVQEAFGPISQPAYKSYLADILRSGQHMNELISDILTMAKLESGQMEMHLETVCLREISTAAIAMVRGTAAGM